MKIHFVASETPQAQAQLAALTELYGQTNLEGCDVIVALGGDGFLLETIHETMLMNKPIYGQNFGSVGFLMNKICPNIDLPSRLEVAIETILHPLRMRAIDCTGRFHERLAVNEVSVFRERQQAAKVRISVDNVVRIEEVICDGVILCTPAGSTAYNRSAHGPIIPLGSSVLGLTPISAFRPRNWRGALLPHTAEVKFEAIEACTKRPISAVADSHEVRNIKEVRVSEDRDVSIRILFDADHSYEERVLAEQFAG